MGVWACGGRAGCGTGYRVRLSRCPRCHNTTFEEEGSMAKISRAAGATNAAAAADAVPSAVVVGQTDEEAPVLWHCLDCTTAYAAGSPACPHCGSTRYSETPPAMPDRIIQVDKALSKDEFAALNEQVRAEHEMEGSEEPSPGSSSETSPEKPQMSTSPSRPRRQSRARKTASRSPKGQTGASSASGTAGDQTAPDTGK